MIKAIFFDFDGTLADTAPGIVLTMQETFREMGMSIPSDEDVRKVIGLPLVECTRVLGALDEKTAEEAASKYRSLFPTFELTHIDIFPEVKETLACFTEAGIRMAICTSRGITSMRRILERHGLTDYFETSVTDSDHLVPKPAPDMVLTLLERMGLSNDEVIVVGDTTFDIRMGNSAGCKTVGVTYGNHSREQILTSSPTWLIDRFSELKNIISV